jgi:signal transduction histidine kinase
VRPGLRLKLVLSLGSLLVLAFVPLFFAVASVAQATMAQMRDASAHTLGRTVVAHVLASRASRPDDELTSLLDAQLGRGGVAAVGLYDRHGLLTAGRALDARTRAFSDAGGLLPESVPVGSDDVRAMRTTHGSALLVIGASGARDGSAAALLRTDASAVASAPLVRLVALYTGIVALALLVFAYFSMTRLVVRPVLELSKAAGRVADGARRLDVPRSGARELDELSHSLTRMTERLLADEEELRLRVAQVERANTELGQAQEHLVRSERLASVGRLAAGVGHEIGNPIAAILGFQELLLAGDLDEAEARDFLVRMKRETERIHHVLRDLLDFARPTVERGPGSAHPPGDVREAIDDAVALCGPQKAFRNVEIVVRVAPDLPRTVLSQERIVQVVLNLLLNAADAMPANGGRVEVRARLADASVARVRIEVEDNGPGIEPRVRDTLFEPFVTTKDVGQGTGLGLAVCLGLVEASGGSMTVEHPTEHGARFVIELPCPTHT